MSRHAAGRADKRKHAGLMRYQWIGADQNAFDPTEHGRVRANAKCQTKNRQNGKTGTTPKHSEAETQVLKKRLH